VTVWQALLRPVEITAGATDWESRSMTVSSRGVVVGNGVYGSVRQLIKHINDALEGYSIAARLTMAEDGSTGKIKVKISSESSFTYQFQDALLARVLGFDDISSHSGSSAYTADYPPLYCFFSPHNLSNRSRWFSMEDFRGNLSKSGSLSGVRENPHIYSRELAWECNELSYYDQDSYPVYTISSADYHPYAERSWEEFLRGAINAQPTVTASAGCPCNGFYFVNDGTDLISDYPSAPVVDDTTGSGGILYDILSGADYYTWCVPQPRLSEPDHFLPRGRDYHSLKVDVVTATAPTWTHLGVTIADPPT